MKVNCEEGIGDGQQRQEQRVKGGWYQNRRVLHLLHQRFDDTGD